MSGQTHSHCDYSANLGSYNHICTTGNAFVRCVIHHAQCFIKGESGKVVKNHKATLLHARFSFQNIYTRLAINHFSVTADLRICMA